MAQPLTKKDYILVSSDYRTKDSKSSTDFTVKMAVPLHNVIKTDLVQVVMEYWVANIVAPDNEFNVKEGLVQETVVLEEGLYTVDTLATWIQSQLTSTNPYTVTYDSSSRLIVERKNLAPLSEMLDNGVEVAPFTLNDFAITVSSSILTKILGVSLLSQTVVPVNNASDGEFGTLRWAFPDPTVLKGISPYLFIQSNKLGADIHTANNNLAFWRMVMNDTLNYEITMTNNRVDTYLDAPRTLQDIDIKLLFPDGSVVNNNGGSFTLLLEIVRQIG